MRYIGLPKLERNTKIDRLPGTIRVQPKAPKPMANGAVINVNMPTMPSTSAVTTRPVRSFRPSGLGVVSQLRKMYLAAMAAGFHSVGVASAAGAVTVTGRAWTTQTGSPSRRWRSRTHSTSTG